MAERDAQPDAAQTAVRHTGGGSQAALQREIESCRRKLALQTAGRRLLVLLAIAAVPPLLFVVADHSQPAGLPHSTALTIAHYWRWVFGLSCLVLLALTFRRRLSPLFAARVLERTSGIDNNSVINAVLLQREPRAAYASLAAAEQAAADLSEHWPPRVSESGAMRLPFALAAAVVLAWIGYALLAVKPVWPSVRRFFGENLPAPTATTLEQVRPRPGEPVRAGQALGLEFAAHGGTVRQVTLEVFDSTAESGEQAAQYELKPGPEANANWQLTLAPHEVSHDISYRCSANDAVLTGVIPVLPVPLLTGLEIELQPPAYSGLPVQVVSNPDLEVLAGTRATFRAFANTVVENATFALSNDHETRTRMDVDASNPRGFGVSLVLVEGGQYRIEFHDRLGVGVKDPPAHRITLRPDSAPVVNVIEPAEADTPGGVVDITRQTALVAVAEDDVRLAAVELVRADAGVLARTTLKMELDADGLRGRVRVPTADLPLKPGQQMRAWFEASDSHTLIDGTPAPHIGRSRELILSRPPETARNRASNAAEQQTTTEKPTPPEPKEAAGQQPQSSPAGEEPGADSAGEQKGDQPGKGEGSSEKGGFERELKRFVEENGEMARDVGRHVPKPGGSEGEPGGSEGEPGGGPQNAPQSQPGSSPQQPGSSPQRPGQSQPSTAPAGGQGVGQNEPPARPGTQPHGSTLPQSQPVSQPTLGSSQPATSSGDQGQPSSNNQNSQTGKPSEPTQCEGKPCQGQPDQKGEGERPGRSSAGQKEGERPGQSSAGQKGEADQPGQRSAGDKPDQSAGQNGQTKDQSGGSGEGTGSRRIDPPPGSQPAALPEAPQEPGWRERSAPLQTEGLIETLDLLEWLDRGGMLDESMLIDLGWPADKTAAFVKSLERLHEQARQAGGLTELRTLRVRVALGDPNVQHGGGLSTAARTTVDQARPHEDDLRRIAPPPEQEVPPELRPLLDAYYRALAQRQNRGS